MGVPPSCRPAMSLRWCRRPKDTYWWTTILVKWYLYFVRKPLRSRVVDCKWSTNILSPRAWREGVVRFVGCALVFVWTNFGNRTRYQSFLDHPHADHLILWYVVETEVPMYYELLCRLFQCLFGIWYHSRSIDWGLGWCFFWSWGVSLINGKVSGEDDPLDGWGSSQWWSSSSDAYTRDLRITISSFNAQYIITTLVVGLSGMSFACSPSSDTNWIFAWMVGNGMSCLVCAFELRFGTRIGETISCLVTMECTMCPWYDA